MKCKVFQKLAVALKQKKIYKNGVGTVGPKTVCYWYCNSLVLIIIDILNSYNEKGTPCTVKKIAFHIFLPTKMPYLTLNEWWCLSIKGTS